MTLTRSQFKPKCGCGVKSYPSEAAADRALVKIQGLKLRDAMPKRPVRCWHGQWHLEGARAVDTGPDRNVRSLVMERDDWTCQRCGKAITEGVEYSLQHRLARGSGGTSDPAINSPANLIVLCGSATTNCHGAVTNGDLIEATDLGYVIPLNRNLIPSQMPVFSYNHGLVYLDDEGGWAPAPNLGGAA